VRGVKCAASVVIGPALQVLLTQQSSSAWLLELLLRRLVDSLPDLAHRVRAPPLLRLFKLCFGSMQACPDNEPLLAPYLAPIVSTCLELGVQDRESTNYFLLLRALFRALGQGKYDLFYKVRVCVRAYSVRLHTSCCRS
jgi:transformation/transcription domain-associated protein